MKKIFSISEWISFVVLIALALAPIYCAKWYHTGDGPFHLYSATVLNDILFHSGSSFGNFYDLHITPVPNTSILVFQALMLVFFNPNTVQMLTILILSIGLTGGYLYFIKSINPEHKGVSLLILPVIINFFTVMGLFSFLASLGLMLITVGYFNRNAVLLKRKQIMILACLIILNWFTHIAGALFSLAYIAIYIILMGKERRKMIRIFFIISIPFLLLCLIFAKDAAAKSNPLVFTPFSSLLTFFSDSAPLICYHSDELHFMNYFQYLLLVLFPVSLFYFYIKGIKPIFFTPLVFCLLMTLAFFISPGNALSIKFINYRFLLCAILFFCAFIDAYSPRYCMLLTIPVVIFVLIKKNDFQIPAVKAYSNQVESVIKNTEMLPKGKAVIVMNSSDNWLDYDICLYPAAAHRIMILDNEEASTSNSIIRWKKDKNPEG
ncbi:MAG: hypothetical protein ACXVEB_15685, partial [Bacteroidia bacterium]